MNADTLLYLIEWGTLINLCVFPVTQIVRLTK